MVIISISKLLLVICGLVTIVFAARAPGSEKPPKGMCTPIAVLIAFFAYALSLLWTIAPPADALGSVAKYGKLTLIVLMLLMIRNRREASFALAAFMAAQTFLLASSWMLFGHLPVPWATSIVATSQYSVFSSYLDQGIMTAVFAALCWHFRNEVPGRSGKQVAVFLALAGFANVFFVLSGRSGHVVAIALVSVAIMWELPKKFRILVILLPFLIALGLFLSSVKVRDRMVQAKAEVQAYSTQIVPTTSSGVRLNLWRRALQTISQHPIAGTGVGSWSTQFNRLQREQNPAHVDAEGNGNPHQEYLLWGVQLGIAGILLLLMLLAAVFRDTLKMGENHARATQSTLLALGIACLFNSSIYDALIGDFFCILLGLLLALGLSKPSRPEPTFPLPKAVT